MHRLLAVAVLLALAAPAGAQVIHRCKDASGVVSIQSEPCSAAQRDLGARYYPHVQDDPAAVERRQRIDAEMAQRRQLQQQAAPGYSISRPPRASDKRTEQRIQCELARRNRDETLARLGLRRTYEILRRLNEQVREACKGL